MTTDTNNTWFVTGLLLFGGLIGILVGLSESPVVESLIAALFVFIGGTLFTLIKDKTTSELNVIGLCLSCLSFAMVVGALLGIFLRANDVLSQKPAESHPLYSIDQPLDFKDVIALSNTIEDAQLLCRAVRSINKKAVQKVSKEELLEILGDKAEKDVGLLLSSLFSNTNDCSNALAINSTAKSTQKSATTLHNDEVDAQDIGRMLDE